MAKYPVNYFIRAAATLGFFCFSLYTVRAQESLIDSLKNELTGATVIEQINVNYSLGIELSDQSPDSAIFYYNEALKLTREIGNDTFTARCLNKIGILHFNSGDYGKAIRNFYSALKIFERLGDKSRAIRCLQFLSMAYNEQGMYDQALDFAKKSLEMCIATKDKYSVAISMGSIASIYYARSDYDNALEYFQQALQTMEDLNDKEGIADALNNVAEIYEKKKKPDKALQFHFRSLAMARELNNTRGLAARYHNIGRLYNGMGKYTLAIQYLDSSIILAKEGGDKSILKESYNTLSEAYSGIGDFKKAYEAHLLYSQLSDTLMSEENKKQFAEMNTKYETEKKDNQITLLKKDGDLQQEKLHRQQVVRNGFIGGFAAVLLFAGILFSQHNKIKKEKKRSDELLLNILPSETAEELKSTGEAQAKQFDEVTVMFTDFKNFTQTSEKLSAAELVKEIHRCYSEFDRIISKYNLEKIKTIGDSYMCAGGLPVPNTTNAEDTVRAALEIREFVAQEKQKKDAEGKLYFEIRIGCHSGPVVAGIVGIKKFAYDIWGDTVNIASRMESSGQAGKVNISGTTYDLVKDKFHCTHRGKISAKNKGEIDMYFVEG